MVYGMVFCYMMTKVELVTGHVTIYTFIFVDCLCVPERVIGYSSELKIV